VATRNTEQPDHLEDDDSPIYWDWWGENPVEVVLVAFILIFFFMFPRAGCGIDKTKGSFPSNQPSSEASP
jgi:hypothetical protein